MTVSELKEKIRDTIRKIYVDSNKIEKDAVEYDELVKFPQLKDVIVDLLTVQFADFIDSIDWVAPRPTTFRVNLKNGQNFILIYTERSWIAKVEGKRYYLVNLDEEERAAMSISRILSYGEKVTTEDEGAAPPDLGGGGSTGGGALPDLGGGDEIGEPDTEEPTDEPEEL